MAELNYALDAVVVVAILRSELGLDRAQHRTFFAENGRTRCGTQRDRRMFFATRRTPRIAWLIVHRAADECIVIVAVKADRNAGLDDQILCSTNQDKMF